MTRSSDRARLPRIELEFRPDPPEPVRRAIVAALEAVREDEEADAWWRAGVAEGETEG
jgi:hypothetical protein